MLVSAIDHLSPEDSLCSPSAMEGPGVVRRRDASATTSTHKAHLAAGLVHPISDLAQAAFCAAPLPMPNARREGSAVERTPRSTMMRASM